MCQLHCHVSILSRSFSTNMALGSKPFQKPRPALIGSNRNNMCSVCNRSAGLKTAADKSCVTSFLASLIIVERAKQNQQRIWPVLAPAIGPHDPFMKCRRISPLRLEPPGCPGKVRAMCCCRCVVMFRSFHYPSKLPWLCAPNPFNNMFYVCDW